MKILTGATALTLAALAVPALAQAPAASPEPACGTKDAPKACVSLTTGAVSVIVRDAKREYATAGILAEAPLPHGLHAEAAADVFAVQDGELAGAAGIGRPFRAVKLEAAAGGDVGPLQVLARGGTTLSIEGQVGAPLDPRQWDALLEARLLVAGGHVALRGGHDGAVGGWAVGADVEIPVPSGPAIVARYELPLQVGAPGQPRTWAITAGARFRVASFRIGK